MISENLKTFYNLPVEDFEFTAGPSPKDHQKRGWFKKKTEDPTPTPGAKPIPNPAETAIRIRMDWDLHDQGVKFLDMFTALLADPNAGGIKALIIGDWGGAAEGNGIEPIVEALVNAKDKLPNLEALFLADLVGEESEISWIQQGDVSPLWSAYPGLIEFGVRGGEGLSLGKMILPNLKKLVIEAGGLPPSVVKEVASAELPELEHLEIWLGTDEYGGDSTMDDVNPILNSTSFPKLAYLGLKNSILADDIAAAVDGSSIISQLHVLDLSMGTLRDTGVEALASAGNLGHLLKLDIHHHFASPEAIAKLTDLGIAVDASEPHEAEDFGDEMYYYVAVSE